LRKKIGVAKNLEKIHDEIVLQMLVVNALKAEINKTYEVIGFTSS